MIPPPTVEEPPEIIAKAVESLSDGEIAKEKQKLEDIANEESRWAEKSADELLELLLSSKMVRKVDERESGKFVVVLDVSWRMDGCIKKIKNRRKYF